MTRQVLVKVVQQWARQYSVVIDTLALDDLIRRIEALRGK